MQKNSGGLMETSEIFLPLNDFKRISVFVILGISAFLLSLLVIPVFDFRFHFFQAAIFIGALLFGPFAGAAIGGFSASYNAVAMNNLWIIGGNAILGFFAAYFIRKHHPMKAVLMAYAVQLPYLIITDSIVGMPLARILPIAGILFVENILCGLFAWKTKDVFARMLKQRIIRN